MSSSSIVCLTLPLCRALTNTSGFTTRGGVFYPYAISAPILCASSASSGSSNSSSAYASQTVLRSGLVTGVNLLTLNNCPTDWALDHRVSAVLRLGGGSNFNGGLALNYLTTQQTGGGPKYLAAVLNPEEAAFQLLRYNGSTFVTEFSADFDLYPFTFDPDAWYVVSMTPTRLNPGQINSPIVVSCELRKITETAAEISFAVTVAEYGLIAGSVGLFVNQAYTYFSHLTIE